MVKGIAKYAVVVNGTGVDGFEQAIFISGESQPTDAVTSASELLQAARALAGGKTAKRRSQSLAAAAIGFLMGCAATVFVWLLSVML